MEMTQKPQKHSHFFKIEQSPLNKGYLQLLEGFPELGMKTRWNVDDHDKSSFQRSNGAEPVEVKVWNTRPQLQR